MNKLSANAKGALSAGIIAVIYLIEGHDLNYGTAGMPGEGFVPLLMGIGLLACSLLLLIRETVFSPTGEPGGSPEPETGPEQLDLRKPLKLMVILVLYPLLLPYLGFIAATIGLLLGSFRIFAYRNWLWSAGISVVVTLVTYFVFEKCLSVLFPPGIWG